jgi:2-polyprenyl-3-methyl-5-hydroxy-6-metoxy-1,4-benzoquinol methylase
MSAIFDPAQYKINSKANWNTVAFDYHHNWADKKMGPFKSTTKVVDAADIKPNDKVLDIACGTGVVSKEISRHLCKEGFLRWTQKIWDLILFLTKLYASMVSCFPQM